MINVWLKGACSLELCRVSSTIYDLMSPKYPALHRFMGRSPCGLRSFSGRRAGERCSLSPCFCPGGTGEKKMGIHASLVWACGSNTESRWSFDPAISAGSELSIRNRNFLAELRLCHRILTWILLEASTMILAATEFRFTQNCDFSSRFLQEQQKNWKRVNSCW